MKKNNKIKKSVSVLAFLFVCALSVILSSCSDELDIQQSYPFKVETMPVPKDLVRGQTVEIRCELKAEGKFDGTIYTIRYFQHDGKGSLRMENGTVSCLTTAICWRTGSSVFTIPRQVRIHRR